jgi:hypothetical protein
MGGSIAPDSPGHPLVDRAFHLSPLRVADQRLRPVSPGKGLFTNIQEGRKASPLITAIDFPRLKNAKLKSCSIFPLLLKSSALEPKSETEPNYMSGLPTPSRGGPQGLPPRSFFAQLYLTTRTLSQKMGFQENANRASSILL